MLQRAALGAVVLAGASILLAGEPIDAAPPRPTEVERRRQQPPTFDNVYDVTAGSTVTGTLAELGADDLLVYASLRIEPAQPPTAGTLTVDGDLPDGTFAFAAAETFAGTARADYTGETAEGERVTASVVFRVRTDEPDNNPPTAVDDPVTVNPGSSTRIRPMANDQDPDAGDLLTLTGVQPPILGGVTVQVEGTTIRVRVPVDAPPGTRRFRYTVTDGRGATTTGVLAVTVRRRAEPPTSATRPGSGPGTSRPSSVTAPTSGPSASTTEPDEGSSTTTDPARAGTTSPDALPRGTDDVDGDGVPVGDVRSEGGHQDLVADREPDLGDGGSGNALVGGIALLTIAFGTAALIAYRRSGGT